MLEARDLWCTYVAAGARVDAVAGVSVAVPAGCLILVRGASGSGKTTLLNLLGGLQPATSGAVLFDGRDISRLSSHRLTRWRRSSVALIFQTLALLPELTAFENVDLGLRVAGVAPVLAARRADRRVGPQVSVVSYTLEE